MPIHLFQHFSHMKHPYYPKSLSLPHFQPNSLQWLHILVGFFSVVAVVLSVAWYASGTRAGYAVRALSKGERAVFLWFILCALIHTFFEGYFVLFHQTMSSDVSWFGQAWKEYAMSDSRYLFSDPAVLGIEGITAALWGPLSFGVAYCMLKDLPIRYALQFIISFGQLYGCVLYYITAALEGFPHSHPSPHYFVGYFVLMNLPWIVVPCIVIFNVIQAMNVAFSSVRKSKRK